MNRRQLEHAIRAACDAAEDDELWVFGSQAILGEHPRAPEALRQSDEVDVAPRNEPERLARIQGALGELSRFHRTYGFYVHGLPIESAELPPGWQDRATSVSGRGSRPSTGWCLEAHDLAASKLVAFREKDRDFVRVMIVEELVCTDVLLTRVRELSVSPERQHRLCRWIEATGAER